MTGIFNTVSLEIVLIASADLEGSFCSSQWRVHLYCPHLGFCCWLFGVFCLQLLILNTLISLVDIVTVLVDCYSNSRKCL